MSMRAYCTYFDHRYLPKGLAMIRSLRRYVPDANVWVLCLSSQAQAMLEEMGEPGVHTIILPDFEAGDNDLAKAKADGRSTIEYYFTLTPSLILYVMHAAPEAGIVTYLDGDLWFLSDPQVVYREMGQDSVLIIPHGFEASMKHLEQHGAYNVGWISFRQDADGKACLEWWRQRTNEWCFDRVEDGRFADQGYLDQFPHLFGGVHILANQGANLAPWNVAARTISVSDGILRANGDQVLFFHFHGLKRLEGDEYLTSHGLYKARLTPLVHNFLYRPYLREIQAIEREVAARFGQVEHGTLRHSGNGRRTWLSGFKKTVKMALNRYHGYVITAD